eukprot:7382373-Prymnesium_polylepis.3
MESSFGRAGRAVCRFEKHFLFTLGFLGGFTLPLTRIRRFKSSGESVGARPVSQRASYCVGANELTWRAHVLIDTERFL